MYHVERPSLSVFDVPSHTKVKVSIGGARVREKLQEISGNVRHWLFELDRDGTSHTVQVETYAQSRISRFVWKRRTTNDYFGLLVNSMEEGNYNSNKSWTFRLPNAGLDARLQDTASPQTSELNSPFHVGNIHHNNVGRDQYNIEYRSPTVTRNTREIPQCEIEELDYISDSRNVVYADHLGKKILQKKYADEDTLVEDMRIWRDNKSPYVLQLYGRSPSGTDPFYLLLHHPGRPVQTYIEEIFDGEASTASIKTIELMKGITHAARYLSDRRSGGFQLNVADVHVRSQGTPVLVNFHPSVLHSGIGEGVINPWDSFISLINKSVIGHPTKPNYAVGQYGATGQTATELTRLLLHFLWGFRFFHGKYLQGADDKTNNWICLFDQLQDAMDGIAKDIGNAVARNDNDNPLLCSLQQRFSSRLCGIWDVWEPLSVEPGDIGYFDGTDPKRPKFHKISTVPSQILEKFSLLSEGPNFKPDTAMWRCDTLADGVTRYTLHLPNEDEECDGDFSFYRDWDRAMLNSQWDVSSSWEYFWNNRENIKALAKEHGRKPSDLCLIFSYSQSACYSKILIQVDNRSGPTPVHPTAILKNAGFPNGILYFFENPTAKDGQVKGYWSASPDPGKPHWPPSTDEIGNDWGWEYIINGIRIEIPRKGPVQHIRYLSL